MMMGAKVTIVDWIVWNVIPVTAGNIVGGFVFTGLAIYWTYRPAADRAVSQPIAAPAPAE